MSDWHIEHPQADDGEHAVDQLGPSGTDNHHFVLNLIKLPLVLGLKLRVLLDSRGGGVAHQGLTTQQIADELFLIYFTDQTHCKNITQKLHLTQIKNSTISWKR